MKLTNKHNLPGPLFKAICNDSYNPGDSDYTATGLIEPPRIGALKALHKDEISEDASDLIYSLQGQSIHTILERAAKDLESEGYIPEKRFYHSFNNTKVGAQIDVFHPATGVLQDYKVTSVYSIKDGAKEEHAQQMNIQAELLRRNGYEVKVLQIVAILRDWSKGEYERERASFGEHTRYPSSQVSVIDIPLIPSEEVVAFILERIDAHNRARQGDLPECSDAERWAAPTKFALMKRGQKRAKSLHSTREAAELMLGEDKSLHVVERPGVNRRCESYCSVSAFCKQFQEIKNKQTNGDES